MFQAVSTRPFSSNYFSAKHLKKVYIKAASEKSLELNFFAELSLFRTQAEESSRICSV